MYMSFLTEFYGKVEIFHCNADFNFKKAKSHKNTYNNNINTNLYYINYNQRLTLYNT